MFLRCYQEKMILWDRKMLRENASWPQALLPAPKDPRPPWGRAGPACCWRGTPWPPRRSSRCASAPRGSDGSGTSHEHHFPGRCHIFNPSNTFLLRYHRNKKILYVFSVFHQEYFTARKTRWLSISPVEQAKKTHPMLSNIITPSSSAASSAPPPPPPDLSCQDVG